MYKYPLRELFPSHQAMSKEYADILFYKVDVDNNDVSFNDVSIFNPTPKLRAVHCNFCILFDVLQ